MLRYSEGRFVGIMLIILGLLVAAIYMSLSYGVFELTFAEVCKTLFTIQTDGEYNVLIYQFRLPRVLIAGLAGAGLGVAGAVLQGLSRNGLADPGILGINAGAGLGMIIFMFFYQGKFVGTDWLSVMAMPFFGLVGGLAASFLIYLLSWKDGRLDPQRFLLTGIALGSGFGALSLCLTLKMSPADFHAAAIWNIGSLFHANWQYIISILPWFLFLLPITLWKAHILDLFQLEESIVRSLGVAVGKEQTILLLCSTGLVSTCVAVSGNIGFVGLIVPHLAKALVGIHHQRVIPLCAMLGMLFVILADFIAKNIFAPAEVAVGIIIALIGVPYFIYLLFKSKTY